MLGPVILEQITVERANIYEARGEHALHGIMDIGRRANPSLWWRRRKDRHGDLRARWAFGARERRRRTDLDLGGFQRGRTPSFSGAWRGRSVLRGFLT